MNNINNKYKLVKNPTDDKIKPLTNQYNLFNKKVISNKIQNNLNSKLKKYSFNKNKIKVELLQ